MLVDTLLDTAVHVHYGFLTLSESGADPGDPEESFRGQVNGLCGAAVPGVLSMRTGLQTGNVGVRIELHTDEPVAGDGWQDIVETLFSTRSDDLSLAAFDHQLGPVDLPPGTYRVRYSCRDLQRGRDEDTLLADEPVDHYLLQFWPVAGEDRIVRRGSATAELWHGDGVEPGPDRAELAARIAELRQRREETAGAAAEDAIGMWGLDADSTVRAWPVTTPMTIDPQVLDAVANAGEPARRAVTAWAAELMLGDAGLMDRPWAARAVAALRSGAGMPRRSEVELPPPGHGTGALFAQHVAVETLFDAVTGLGGIGSAVGVLMVAGQGRDLVPLLRDAFPELF